FSAGAQPEEERRASRDARLRALATMTPAEMAEARVDAVLAPDPPVALRREVVDMLAAIRPSGYAAAANAIYGADERAALPRIDLPVLVVAGDQDAVVPLERVEQLAAAIPGARLAVFPGSGHLTNQEQPRRFDQVLGDFLAGVDA
ncbi:MAG TPA: alpha/beta fold hydrolase, partial [Nitrolancea sp.]|nr:alpha/beta fold hydrolase [Nitrolancea sp.]